jgi:hypothetical protein
VGEIEYKSAKGISGLVVEYIVAIDVTRVRFPADARFASYLRYVGNVLENQQNFPLIRCSLAG